MFDPIWSTFGSGAEVAEGRRAWNDSFSPASPENTISTEDIVHEQKEECVLKFQIGSKLYLEYPIRGHSEAYYQLKKTLGVQASCCAQL